MDEIFIMIDCVWFDVTNFNTHPGGKKILKKYNFQDASDIFNDIKGHHDTFALNFLENFEVRDNEKIKKIEEVVKVKNKIKND